MSSDARINASRENGKKGGVKTDEGRARSAANALKHGVYAHKYSPILSTENADDYHRLRADLIQCHQPANRQEQETVDQLADTGWRINRYEIAQEYFLEHEMSTQAEEIQKLNPDGIPHDLRMSLALHHCLSAQHSAFRELSRLIQRYYRIQQRLLTQLKDLQGPRFGRGPQSEPSPQEEIPGNEPRNAEESTSRPKPIAPPLCFSSLALTAWTPKFHPVRLKLVAEPPLEKRMTA